MLCMGTRVKSRIQSGQRRRHFIKEWRKFRGMTQEQLADQVGVAVSTISQLESGGQGYSQATLEGLAIVLDCEPSDLISRDPTKTASIWTVWEGLEQPARDQALEILKTFKRQ